MTVLCIHLLIEIILAGNTTNRALSTASDCHTINLFWFPARDSCNCSAQVLRTPQRRAEFRLTAQHRNRILVRNRVHRSTIKCNQDKV